MSYSKHPSPLLIPELAELILTSLPPLEVLTTSRRVCKLWRDLIDSSTVIKYHTWRLDSIPGRTAAKIDRLNFQRNPLILTILARFWQSLNEHNNNIIIQNLNALNISHESQGTSAKPKAPKKPKLPKPKKSDPPQPIPPETLISSFRAICSQLIFANSTPIDVNINLSSQKYASKHMLHRSYRSVASEYGIGWVTDTTLLENMMEEMVGLYNEKVYIPGKKNSLQAEMRYCVFLYEVVVSKSTPGDAEGGNGSGRGKRTEYEAWERVDF
ncbi:hypothetical protein TWF694_005399 [Orbilia ellipsospora]|uniref:F-box domain-containing protein n=1 Tax=Orbilia ellipsospora TaxID=2528407 RepID=A0AAV9WT13_9PEZI